MEVNDLILQHAQNYIGIEEIAGNQGWHDENFENKIQELVGWKKGEAWCAYFAALIWREVYRQINMDIDQDLESLFSPSAVQTWKNFHESPRWQTSKYPVKGSVVIWQTRKKGKWHWTGHAGILSYSITDVFVRTIEGNTDKQGTRTGGMVTDKRRKKNFGAENGLIMLGFIQPKQITEKIDMQKIKI